MKTHVAGLVFATLCATPALAVDFAPMALNSLSIAPAKLAAAPVLDRNGKRIGTLRGVVTDTYGRPAAISYVARADSRLRVLAAPAVSYDAQKNLLIADTAMARLGEQVAANAPG